MKLYTEEQVRQMLIKMGNSAPLNIDYLINEITPIELPTDEEIEQESNNEYQEQKQSYENSVEMLGHLRWLVECSCARDGAILAVESANPSVRCGT